jgi:hypothetical protein
MVPVKSVAVRTPVMAVMEAAVAPARLRDERIAGFLHQGQGARPDGRRGGRPFGTAGKPPTIANAIAADLKIRMVLLLLARIA